jgi:hypothetical protein
MTYGVLLLVAAAAAFVSIGIAIHSYNKREF